MDLEVRFTALGRGIPECCRLLAKRLISIIAIKKKLESFDDKGWKNMASPICAQMFISDSISSFINIFIKMEL